MLPGPEPALFVTQYPCARLEYRVVARLRPGPQHRIGGKPRIVREYVPLHVGDRCESESLTMCVEQVPKRVVEACGTARPELAVIGRRRLRGTDGVEWRRRMLRRRQHRRAVRDEHVRDAQQLGDRRRRDLERRRPDDDVAAVRRLGDDLELCGDHVRDQLSRALWRGW
jgi:hypothetical protein